MRKGQITLFILIGLGILIVVGSILYFKNVFTLEKLKTTFSPTLSQADVVGVLAFINDCTKTTALEGIANVNSIQNELKGYIEANVKHCLGNFKSFKNKGFNFTEIGDFKVSDIVFSSEVIYILIDYPLIIKKAKREYEFKEGYAEIPLAPPVVELVLSKPNPPEIPTKPVPLPKVIVPVLPPAVEPPKSSIKRPFNCPFINEKELQTYCLFKIKVAPIDTGLSCLDVFIAKRPMSITFLSSFLESEDDSRIKYETQLLTGQMKEILPNKINLKELGGKYYLFMSKGRVFIEVIMNMELCENVDDLAKFIYESKIK